MLLGLIVLLGLKQLKAPEWINISTLILIVFLVINLADSYIFKLGKELKEFWTLNKAYYLIIGLLAGAIIVIIPKLVLWLTGFSAIESTNINTEITFSSVIGTLIIVGWEELWFRGMFLNYCKKYLSVINLSLTMGLLFMLIHTLNPDISLIRTGPTLFFAGALLTLLYFYYKNIWLPLGLHFGNNYFGTVIEVKMDNHLFFGNEGYLSAIILGILVFVYVKKFRSRQKLNALNL